jgi:hypothetical protein
MQVGVRVLREVEVDDNIHSLDVNTSGEQVSADKTPCLSILEVMIDPIQN